MSQITLYPKDLYIPTELYSAALFACSNDNDHVITWYLNLKQDGTEECFNGSIGKTNIVFIAVQKLNQTLLKYLCEHIADPRMLNMHDATGKAALAKLVDLPVEQKDNLQIEKKLCCINIMLNHGADPNAKKFEGESFKYDEEPKGQYIGDTIAGQLLKLIEKEYAQTPVGPNADNAEKILMLFLQRKAECYINTIFLPGPGVHPNNSGRYISIGNVGEQSCIHADDDQEIVMVKERLSGRIRSLRAKVLDEKWQKLRYFVLAERSKESNVAKLNPDIIKIIRAKIAEIDE